MTEPTKRDKMPCDYTKKPVTIQAIEWTGDNLRAVINFTGLHESAAKWSWEEYEQVVKKDGLKIFTLEGQMMASIGDYIIRGVKGEFYPCKPDIFAATYAASAQSAEPDESEFPLHSAAFVDESAEPQEAEAVLRRYIKGNSPIDWDRIKPLIDAYAVARLASKPSQSEAPELDEKALADTAYGLSGYNPDNEWQNCRDMINHIQWLYHKHAGDSGVDEATENALASLDLLHKHYAARPSREEEMREALDIFIVYSVTDEDDIKILGAYRTEDEAESARNEFGAEVDDEDVVEIWIESTKLAALAQGGARDEGEGKR
ncbi:MAG: hypothetical protein WC455_23780 [Dehalococcoidia bacterium]|jgi:hypothetical protein